MTEIPDWMGWALVFILIVEPILFYYEGKKAGQNLSSVEVKP